MKREDWQDIIRALSLLTQVGIIIVVNIGLGFFLGYLLDNLLGTSIIFKVIGLLTGVGSGFYSDYRLIKKTVDDKQEEE